MRPLQNITAEIAGLVVLEGMTELLMIRHGQSVANIERFFAGHLNSPLTALGESQAQLTANYIRQNYQIDCVYASDLDRAFATGKAVADLFNLPVKANQQLREIYAGAWEGVCYDELSARFPETYPVWLQDIGKAVCDGGESVAALQERILKALTHICRDHPGKCVVVATHATPIRTLQCYAEGKSLDQLKDVPWVSNASVSSFFYEDGVFQKNYISKDTHLGQLTSVLPKNC